MGGRGQKGALLPKICHTYLTMMKPGTVIPYLKKIQKTYESRDTPPKFCWHQRFFTGNQQILLYHEIQIWIGFWCIISNSFNFSSVFEDFFKKPVYNFDDVSKIGYPNGVMTFWNKGSDVTIQVGDVTNKILSRGSNYIVDVFMWPKFGNFHFYDRSYHNLNFVRAWPEKRLFSMGGLGSSSIIWDRD